MSETTSALQGIAAPADLWDDAAAAGSARSRGSPTAPTCSAPIARSRTRAAATPRRRGPSPTTPGRETRVLWVKGSGTDLATITPAGFAALRLDEILPLRAARRDGRRRDGRLPPAHRARARPAATVDRDASARVRLRAARRPHAPGRRDRAHVLAGRTPARGGRVRRRGGVARLPAARLRHVTPDRGARGGTAGRTRRPAREARARHLGRDRRGELQEHARVRRPCRRRDPKSGWRKDRTRRDQGRSPRGHGGGRSARRRAPGSARRSPRRRRRRRAGDRPEPRGSGVRLVGAGARGQPGRRAVP